MLDPASIFSTPILNTSPIDEPLFRYLVVVDGDELVAGACVGDGHKVMWLAIDDLLPELEEADALPDSIPESREIRMTAVRKPWYRPGHAAAGEALLDAIRALPDTGNRISMAVDPAGPVGDPVEIDEEALDMTVPMHGAEHRARISQSLIEPAETGYGKTHARCRAERPSNAYGC